jgi:flagellar basal body-associated protein FliL
VELNLSEVTVEKPDPNVVVSKQANPYLIVLGILLVLTFVGGMVYSRAVGSETKETTPPANQTSETTKTTKSKDAPSDTLLTALLGAGAGLIIVGALYGRISTIKLPGGTEISLTPEEKEKAAKKVIEKLSDDVDPAKAVEVTQEATDRLLQAKAYSAYQLPDEKIDHVVSHVVEQVGE